jgi:hypothetical protein
MVAVSSEVGLVAMEKLKNIKKDEQREVGQEQIRASVQTDLEYTRTRMQR